MGIPALLTIIVMPFTYSITNGVPAGFVSYVIVAVLRGKWREVHPLLYAIARSSSGTSSTARSSRTISQPL
jgi:AGZA family xanthine/uracil permease-like MFS transporter